MLANSALLCQSGNRLFYAELVSAVLTIITLRREESISDHASKRFVKVAENHHEGWTVSGVLPPNVVI